MAHSTEGNALRFERPLQVRVRERGDDGALS